MQPGNPWSDVRIWSRGLPGTYLALAHCSGAAMFQARAVWLACSTVLWVAWGYLVTWGRPPRLTCHGHDILLPSAQRG